MEFVNNKIVKQDSIISHITKRANAKNAHLIAKLAYQHLNVLSAQKDLKSIPIAQGILYPFKFVLKYAVTEKDFREIVMMET